MVGAHRWRRGFRGPGPLLFPRTGFDRVCPRASARNQAAWPAEHIGGRTNTDAPAVAKRDSLLRAVFLCGWTDPEWNTSGSTWHDLIHNQAPGRPGRLGPPRSLRRTVMTVTITTWSDIGCPWAALALHTLRAAADRRGDDLLIDHRAFPLELFNRIPTPKYIVDAEVVAIAALRPELGWRRWSGPEWTYPVTTLPALEAVQAVKAVDGLRGSDELDAALRVAFYTEGRCISVHSEILDVAEACPHVDAEALAKALAAGSGRAEVYEQWEEAKTPAVQGSPHFFTGDGFRLHNPGVVASWSASPLHGGFPRLESYSTEWADDLLDRAASS